MERPSRPLTFDHRIAPFLREAQHAMLDCLDLRAGNRILSIECQDGWAAEEAWRRVKHGYICGVDSSNTMVALAQQYRGVPGSLEFLVWEHGSLPFPDHSFDVVITTYSVARFQDPVEVLREAARVLVPGGRLLMLEATKYSFGGLYVLLDWFNRRVDPGHVRYYSQTELRDMLHEAGFDHTRLKGRFQRLLAGGKLFANWLLLENRTQPVSR